MDELLHYVKELKYVRDLISRERMKWMVNRLFSVMIAMMRAVFRSVVQAKIQGSQIIGKYTLLSTYGHEWWVMTEKMVLHLQVAEISFVHSYTVESSSVHVQPGVGPETSSRSIRP